MEIEGRQRYCRYLLAAWVVAVALLGSAEAASPVLTRFRPDLDVFPQYFSLAQGPDRLLYVGGDSFVLSFDGTRWSEILDTPTGPVRALYRDRHGRVWVGGFDAFGYIERLPTGEDRFVNISQAFSGDVGKDGYADVWDIVELDDGLYFKALRHIFRVDFNGQRSGYWTNPERYGTPAVLDGELLVQFRGEGLKALRNNRFELLPGGAALASDNVTIMVALGNSSLLIADTTPRVLFWQDGKLRPAASTELAQHVTTALALGPDHVAFGGDDGILRVFDQRDGSFESIVIGRTFLSDLTIDMDGKLLVLSDSGIARMGWPPQILVFGGESGLQGDIRDLVATPTSFFALTGSGVYQSKLDSEGLPGAFVARDWAQGEAWSALGRDENLLIADSYGLQVVRDGRAQRLGPTDLYPRLLVRSPFAADRAWVAAEPGFALVAEEATGWKLLAQHDSPRANVISLTESAPGKLWLGTGDRGLYRASVDPVSGAMQSITAVGADLGLDLEAGSSAYAVEVDGQLVVSTDNGIFRWDGTRFQKDDLGGLEALLPVDESVGLRPDGEGGLWAYSYRSIYRKAAGQEWTVTEIAPPEGGTLDVVLPRPGGTAFIGSSGSILAYRPSGTSHSETRADLRIAAIRLDRRDGSSERLPVAQSARILHGAGSLAFELGLSDFSATRAAQFQVRIVGLDADWSHWSSVSTLTYAELPPGDYRFEARARRGGNRVYESPPFAFSIVPRWYQYLATQIGFGVLAVALAALLLTWRHQRRVARLSARANELDTLVRARTFELESANRQLRQLADQDGLTGVANRRHFDAVLAAQFEQCAADRLPLSLLLIDVDHFKAYNDSRGHLAGDELLQRIAMCLLEAVREGSLVARYGGEEFVVLAPECSAEQAAKLGERLRNSIATCLQGITVSIGSGTRVPRAGQDPEILIADADAALYRAKHLGRNRVEATPAEAH